MRGSRADANGSDRLDNLLRSVREGVYSAIYDVTEFDGWYADHTGLYGQIGPSEYSDDALKPLRSSAEPLPPSTRPSSGDGRGKSL